MHNRPFILNQRFTVCPERNLLKDAESGDEIRLEPRIVSLLCLLTDHVENLVSRDTIIAQIWNDYGSADDGLNQAISFLRKALKDTRKNIIETVPKKGYVLHAMIERTVDETKKEPRKLLSYKKYILAVSIVILCIISRGIFYWRTQAGSDKAGEVVTNTVARLNTNHKVAYDEIIKPAEQTFLNSISTIGPDSTTYRLVAIGDKLPDFYVNNQLVPVLKREEYTALIDGMLRQLWSRQKQWNDSLSSIDKTERN